jgi:uncharacterized protein (TIGR00645 family)
MSEMIDQKNPQSKRALGSFIFLSRWLQAPLYLGLILAQAVYVYRFILELWHLIDFAVLGGEPPVSVAMALPSEPAGVAESAAPVAAMFQPRRDPEAIVMLSVLGLIDVVMIANLLIMVIVGGYETFVSRLNLQGHPDQPEWLSHVNAGILKVKLATALIGISSIHLLKTFINAHRDEPKTMLWQVVIHLTFVVSALILAWIDRLTFRPADRGLLTAPGGSATAIAPHLPSPTPR